MKKGLLGYRLWPFNIGHAKAASRDFSLVQDAKSYAGHLLLFHDGGTLIMRAPPALVTHMHVAADMGHIEMLQPGDVVHVIHRQPNQRNKLSLLAAEVEAIQLREGIPMLTLRSLTGQSIEQGMADPAARRISAALLAEGIGVTRDAGVQLETIPKVDANRILKILAMNLPTFLLRRLFRLLVRTHPAARWSTWQSLAKGHPTEIEYLNGEIVKLAGGTLLVRSGRSEYRIAWEDVVRLNSAEEVVVVLVGSSRFFLIRAGLSPQQERGENYWWTVS